jgi:hypothetical protein
LRSASLLTVEMSSNLRGMISWTHRREVLLQLTHGTYASSKQARTLPGY